VDFTTEGGVLPVVTAHGVAHEIRSFGRFQKKIKNSKKQKLNGKFVHLSDETHKTAVTSGFSQMWFLKARK
jgi:hypothetical protein